MATVEVISVVILMARGCHFPGRLNGRPGPIGGDFGGHFAGHCNDHVGGLLMATAVVISYIISKPKRSAAAARGSHDEQLRFFSASEPPRFLSARVLRAASLPPWPPPPCASALGAGSLAPRSLAQTDSKIFEGIGGSGFQRTGTGRAGS